MRQLASLAAGIWQLAAGIMKLGTALVMVVAMIFVFGEWVRSSTRRTAAPAS